MMKSRKCILHGTYIMLIVPDSVGCMHGELSQSGADSCEWRPSGSGQCFGGFVCLARDRMARYQIPG